MQNVQNAAEIQQKVINLVELYRTKVGKESKTAKDAKALQDYWEQESINMAIESEESGELFFGGLYGEGPHTRTWIKQLMVNEQLLGHFYAMVAGENAEKAVLNRMVFDLYDNTVFSEEEESFLKTHFKEMVNYIILTPCDECLELVNRYDTKDIYLIPQELLELVANRINIHPGSVIFNPFTGFAQFTNLYHGCKFYCEESYELFKRRWNAFCSAANLPQKRDDVGLLQAWMKVALYANAVDVEVIESGDVPSSYDAVLSYLPQIPKIEDNEAFAKVSKTEGMTVASRISQAYQNLNDGGVMGLLIPSNQLYENEKQSILFWSFLEMLVKERTLSEIIQLPQIMGNNVNDESFCLLIAKKGFQENNITLIDARTASDFANTKHNMQSIDIAKFHAIMDNDGKDPNTGLRKVVRVSAENLSHYLLVPEVYAIEKPSETENPVPLSSLCTLESTLIRDVQYDLPEDTPWITTSDLTPLFVGDMNMSEIRKADCPNNPPFVEGSKDYAFGKDGKFVDSIWVQMNSKKGYHVLEYRQCTFLDGNTDAVLYKRSDKHGVQVAVVRATGKPYAVSKGIFVFCPKESFDAYSLAALLRLPIVYRQLVAYQKYGIGYHLDDILAPTDKCVIGDELSRMKKEKSVTSEMMEDFETGHKKHLAKLENYQHTMRKHIREIGSAVRRMSRYISEMNSSIEVKEYLNQRLSHISEQKGFLSEDIERLNEENTYGEAKPYDIDHCLKGYTDYFGEDVCSINYSNEIAKEQVKKFRDEHKDEKIDKDVQKRMLNEFFKERSTTYVDIAEYNFGKIVRNILENAKKHGFNDFKAPRTNERKVEILLSWDDSKQMYRIDFRNNGEPLTDGLSKDSFGEFRKYAGETGGSGIGGYEIAETVKYYSGDYSISQEGDWVVVSIFLPQSKSYEQERV